MDEFLTSSTVSCLRATLRNRRLPVAEARLEELKATATNVARFLGNAKKHKQIDELTPEILHTFIPKVTIGERSRRHSGNATRKVKICYRDVGLMDEMPEAAAGEAELNVIHSTVEVA